MRFSLVVDDPVSLILDELQEDHADLLSSDVARGIAVIASIQQGYVPLALPGHEPPAEITHAYFLQDTTWPIHFYGPQATAFTEMFLRAAAEDGWEVVRRAHVREVLAELPDKKRLLVVVPAAKEDDDPSAHLKEVHALQGRRRCLAVLGVTDGDDVPKAWKFYAKLRVRVEADQARVTKDLTRMLGHQGRTFRVEHDGE